MAKIKSKGTKIELTMKAELDKQGIPYEYQPNIFGRPDFLIPPNIVVFCDSSFWHGRDWNKLKDRLPSQYWKDHIKRNIKRDRLVTAKLKKDAYIVLRFWDDQIEKDIEASVKKISMTLAKIKDKKD